MLGITAWVLLQTALPFSGSGVAPAGAAPVDNPLKGLMPYQGQGVVDGRVRFPHSMEFNYVPLSDLSTGPQTADWRKLDALIADVASRGNQTVFRVFLEYPGREDGIPPWMIRSGVKTTTWFSGGTPPQKSITPDYRNPILRRHLTWFIGELGRRYDGDVRVAALTMGVLGSWGEWHTYPHNDLFAPKEVQEEVLGAFARAFRRTPVLHRYPAGAADPVYVANVGRGFGYHDDSFAFATLPSDRPEDAWFFMNLMRRAGAQDTWRTRPIGGEIRPEVWGRIFDPNPPTPSQPFDACVWAARATWLMDTGMFREEPSAERRRRAEASVRRMGYDLRLTRWSVARGSLNVTLTNLGVAPFYQPWRAEAAVIDSSGRVRARLPLLGTPQGLLPRETRTWRERVPGIAVPPGTYRLAIRVPNPMRGGKPIGFANGTVGPAAERWSLLGAVRVAR